MVTKSTKRKQFRAALALAGKTQAQFAVEQGVTPGHLGLVLSGDRTSAALTAKIDAFTEKHLALVNSQ